MRVITRTVNLFKYPELSEHYQQRARCVFVADTCYPEELTKEQKDVVNKPFIHKALCESAQWYDERGQKSTGILSC